jgi:hypothetical protein
MCRLKPPLNKEAVRKADNAFYALHPELVKKDGQRIPLSTKPTYEFSSPNYEFQRLTFKQIPPSSNKLIKEWQELYKKHGGKVEPKNETQTKKLGNVVQKCPKKSRVVIDNASIETDNIEEAIRSIKESNFAKTEEGMKVLAKIEELQKSGKIKFEKLSESVRGNWKDSGILSINKSFKFSVGAIASVLIHEATHAVDRIDYPKTKGKGASIDEEMRTNENQLDFYEEQRAADYRDPELERRRKARTYKKLRDDVIKRYPHAPKNR